MKCMTKKSLLALTLAAVLSASAFAGCGNGGANQSGSSSTPSKESTAGSSGSSTPSTESKDPVEIVIYTYSLGLAVQQPSTAEALKMVQDYVAEKIGVFPKLIMAPSGSEVEKLNTLLASKEQIDAFGGDWGQYYSKNVIIPLNTLLDEHGKDVKAAWSEEAWATATDKEGNIWCVTKSTPTTPYPTFVRTDWLKTYGLEIPTDFDSLENVLKTFKEKDPAGNGQTIPLLTDSVANLSMVLSAGYTGKGYNIRYFDESDGKVKPMVFNADYKAFIEKMADWYKKGYIYKESFAKPAIRDLIKANKVGVNANWYSNVTFSEPVLAQNVADAHFEIATIKGPKAEFSETPAMAGRGGTMITKMAKNPEAVMKFINWGYEDIYNFITLKDGIEGVHWKFVNPELKINELIDPDNVPYRNELSYLHIGMAIEQKLNTENVEQKTHYDYIRNKNLVFDRTIKQDEFGMIYDSEIVKNEVPMQTDIHTMIEENLVGFVTGTKPMSDWDTFLADLDKAGLQTYIDVYTREYQAMKK